VLSCAVGRTQPSFSKIDIGVYSAVVWRRLGLERPKAKCNKSVGKMIMTEIAF